MAALSNPKHERFAQALAKGETADAAYSSAGFKANRGNATRLKANESVEARVTELQERAAIKVELGVADIVTMLQEDRELAREIEQPGAAVSASMGIAKILGLIIDRNELTGKNGGPIQTQDVSEDIEVVDKLIGQLAERHDKSVTIQ